MSFADKYLEKNNYFNAKISNVINKDLSLLIVIPCINEPDLLLTLNSIATCKKPRGSVEIIVVVNSSVKSHKGIIDQNHKTLFEIESEKSIIEKSWLKLHVLHFPDLPAKLAGAGFARKLGMDEATFRFNSVNKSDGVILSLDADSVVSENYLVEVERSFLMNKKASVATMYYEHPLEGTDFDEEVYSAIIDYELYLRYYKHALEYTGYPYAYYTIGSCFAVKAETYIKVGGMNKRQAGEDFYFLNKVFPLDSTIEINSCTVFPSPRPSDRVIFGTGAAVKDIIQNNDIYTTFSLQAFQDLKNFFLQIGIMFDATETELNEIKQTQKNVLPLFLEHIDFEKNIIEIKKNTANENSFRKRFFSWFNGLIILRYLNYSHSEFYSKLTIDSQSNNLLKIEYSAEIHNADKSEILSFYRNIDRETEKLP